MKIRLRRKRRDPAPDVKYREDMAWRCALAGEFLDGLRTRLDEPPAFHLPDSGPSLFEQTGGTITGPDSTASFGEIGNVAASAKAAAEHATDFDPPDEPVLKPGRVCPHCLGDPGDGRTHGRIFEDGPVLCVQPASKPADPRCTSDTRAGTRCKNDAVADGRCRRHPLETM